MMNQEVLNLTNDLSQLNSQVLMIKIDINDRTETEMCNLINIDDGIIKKENSLKEIRYPNQIIEQEEKERKSFILKVLSSIVTNNGKLGNIINRKANSPKMFEESQMLAFQKKCIKLIEELNINFLINSTNINLVFNLMMRYVNHFMFFYNDYYIKYSSRNASMSNSLKIIQVDPNYIKESLGLSSTKPFEGVMKKKTETNLSLYRCKETDEKMSYKLKRSSLLIKPINSSSNDDSISLISEKNEINTNEKSNRNNKKYFLESLNDNKLFSYRKNDIHKLKMGLFNGKSKQKIVSIHNKIKNKM